MDTAGWDEGANHNHRVQSPFGDWQGKERSERKEAAATLQKKTVLRSLSLVR
jgi:hypothetical protein